MHGYLSPGTLVRVVPRLEPDAANLAEIRLFSAVSPGSAIDLAVPVASDLLDELFAARLAPVEVEGLAARLGLTTAQSAGFRRMFTELPPRPPEPNLTGDVRTRVLAHASVLLDFGGFTVLTVPAAGPGGCRPDQSVVDFPPRIDVVVLIGGRADRLPIGTLLQLRPRIGVTVAPGAACTSLARCGFPTVVELAHSGTVEIGPLRISGLPGAADGAERELRPTVPLVRLGGRAFVFAADAVRVSGVDAVFTGQDHAGTERLWPVKDDDR